MIDRWQRYLLIPSIVYLAPFYAQAAEATVAKSNSGITWEQGGAVFGALFLVIAFIFLLAWFVKRSGWSPEKQGIQVLRTQSLGSTRQRLMIVQVNQQQWLIGVTPQAINVIGQLDEPVSNVSVFKTKDKTASFQDVLSNAQPNKE